MEEVMLLLYLLLNINRETMKKLICIEESVLLMLLKQIRHLTETVREIHAKLHPHVCERWLDAQEVCQILGICKRTLQAYRARKVIPASRIEGKFYYKKQDIEEYLKSRTNYVDGISNR